MTPISSAFYDIITLMLLGGNVIFMGITIFYIESLWLFLLSLVLMLVFVYLRNVYDAAWENSSLSYGLEGASR